MRTHEDKGLPSWFMLVTGLGVIWGIASVFFCYQSVTLNVEQLMTDVPPPNFGDENAANTIANIARRATFEGARPLWAKAAYIIAALGGLVGALGLLLRKKWSFPVLGVALMGVFVVQVNAWMRGGFVVLSDKTMVISNRDMFIAFATTAIAAGLFYVSMQAWEKNWLK